MKKIKYIGLDMDHTLIRYQTKNFETLVFQLVIEKLISEKQYPFAIREFQFNFDQAVRGLVIDTKNGNILKLSRFGAIRQSAHGTQVIQFKHQQDIYRSVYVDLKSPQYMVIDTAFSIAFCVLYAFLVDFKDLHPDKLPEYDQIATDVMGCVDKSHSDGSLKNEITSDLDHYVIKEPSLIHNLLNYIKFGKKFFILTNSDYQYTKKLLDYALNPFLSEGKSWESLFEYVITLSHKPHFFFENNQFLAIDPQTGLMSNSAGPLKPGIYQGGNARQFTDNLHLLGEDILYIGDHIYGDILRLKKDCNWRTALVVEELGAEIKAHKRSLPIENQIIDLMNKKGYLEQERLDYIAHTHENYPQRLPQITQHLVKLDANISALLKEENRFYNPYWGKIFRTGAEESYFAYQVERFACIYMEKINDLFQQSPLTYFRAYRRLLPHDV